MPSSLMRAQNGNFLGMVPSRCVEPWALSAMVPVSRRSTLGLSRQSRESRCRTRRLRRAQLRLAAQADKTRRLPQRASAGVCARRGRRTGALERAGHPYFLTVKLMGLLVPAAVVTMTSTSPYLALAGTLHLICVSLQEMYLVHA